MTAGIELARWLVAETGRVYRALQGDAQGQRRRSLTDFIASRGGSVSVRDVMRGGPRFRTASAARAALDELATCGLGRWSAAAAVPGRPASEKLQLLESSPSQDAR